MRKSPSLLDDFRTQWRVMHALTIREIHTRYGRENIGFLWVLGEPLLFCAGVAILWTAIRPAHEHGLPMTAIVVTGYVPLTMWRHSIQRAIKAYEANGSLLFHRQVTPLDIIVARWWLEVIGTLMAGVLVVFVAYGLGYMKLPEDPGLVYLGMALQMIFCLATALLCAALSEISDLLEKAVGTLSYLVLPFTGAFIMIDWLPPKYRWAMLWSPSAENIEMVRGGQFGVNAHAHYNVGYAIAMNAVLLLIGLHMTLRVRKHILVQ